MPDAVQDLSVKLPVTLCLAELDDQPYVWIDCVHLETRGRVATLAPRVPLDGRSRQRLARAEAGYLAYEHEGAPLAWKGIARAVGTRIEFLRSEVELTPHVRAAPRAPDPGAPLLRLMYISEGGAGLGADALHAILDVSSRRNREVGITGALCLHDGFFGQILEGPEPAVRELFERIGADPRHTDPAILVEERAAHRLYGGWSMRGIDGESEITAAEELTARLALAGRDDGAEVTRRWIGLLTADSGPAWRSAWLSARRSVLLLRELTEQSAPEAAAAL